MTAWYKKTVKDSLKELKVKQKQGLSTAEAKKRLEKYGPNRLESGKRINPFKLFLSQFNDVLVIVLIIAAFISLGLSFLHVEGSESEGITESLLIFAIVIAIAVIGFLNEYKAEKTVEALKKLVGLDARVIRDGKETEVSADELVPGDIVLLEEGQKVPADMRLLEVRSLQANEASLTGESLPIAKQTHGMDAAALGDQKNMLFSGTIITTGTGVGLVVGTGSDTEIGKIAHMVSEVEDEQTPMQKKLDDLGRKLGALILLVCILVFVIIFFVDAEIANDPIIERLVFAFTVAVALAVAAIPEGLSFVARISLALGARRMAAKNALVRKLSAVEALGSTDVIASDKTGTLTRGEMTVRRIYSGGDIYEIEGTGYEAEGDIKLDDKKVEDFKKLKPILQVGTLCNNSHLKDGKIMGDPTEGALVVSAMKAGMDQAKQNDSFKRVDEIPFSSERKMMTTVHRKSASYLVATKGAPDVMLEHCSKVVWKGKVKKLTPKIKKDILKQNEAMAKQALRVLGFAYKEVKKQPSEKTAEKDLVFLGLQGMMDPPRTEVKEVMHRVHAEAGMRVLMITGDYIETAKAVADEIGIEGEAISGSELDKMSQEEFEDEVEKISVYARVNPEHKIRIVQALKKHGHQVAMTGDGVNDAPAIKAADIGIAMGINGTDAAKEASDLILLDDQFLTIINAVEEGRGIFDNVRKFVSYLLGANIAEVLIVLGGIILFKDPILTATQLLFINIVTDGLPAVALGSDPAEKGTMRFKPYHFQSAIINKQVWVQMFAQGIICSALILWQFWYIREHVSPEEAVAVAFTALVIYELVWLVVLRTNYNIPWFSNPWLSVALVSSLAIQLGVIYIDSLAALFDIDHVSGGDWILMGVGSIVLFIIMKIVSKLVWRYMAEATPPPKYRAAG